MSKKILNHPDREEIIRRLNDGTSIRALQNWLKERYPKNKSLHLSNPTIQNFRKNKLQLEGKVLKDIRDSAATQYRAIEEQQRQALLESSNAYRDKINEIADTHLDVSRKILQMDQVIESRMEYWFNALKNGEATAPQADKEMRQWMDRQMVMLQQYKKFVEGLADKTIEHNINVSVMNDQVGIIRDVIREVISSFDPETAMIFVDKVTKKIGSLEYKKQPRARVDGNVLNTIEAEIIESDNE